MESNKATAPSPPAKKSIEACNVVAQWMKFVNQLGAQIDRENGSQCVDSFLLYEKEVSEHHQEYVEQIAKLFEMIAGLQADNASQKRIIGAKDRMTLELRRGIADPDKVVAANQ